MAELNNEVGRESLYESIANRLEQMILNDSVQIDERLPSEPVLAVSFGVSRPVIREALKLLKERGLINQRQGGRTVICEPNSSHLTSPMNRVVQMKNVSALQIFEIRVALERLSATLAAQYATQDDIDDLRRINREMQENRNDLNARAQGDLCFHRRIAEISRNPLLLMFIESIGELLTEMIRVTLHAVQMQSDGVNYHERIIRTLEMNDPKKADDVMHQHLMLSMRNYEVAMRQQEEKHEE